MKINERLVKQVQDREACIEHTLSKDDLPILSKVIQFIFPHDSCVVLGHWKYYAAIPEDNSCYNMYDIVPSGMVAIPLKDFFVQEEKEVTPVATKWKWVSDEEINDYAYKWAEEGNGHGPDKYFADCNFKNGAKWLRGKILNECTQPKQEVDKVEDSVKLPSAEDIKRWFQLLVGIGEDAMRQDFKTTFNQPKQQ